MNYWRRRQLGRGERKLVFLDYTSKEFRAVKRAGRARRRYHQRMKRVHCMRRTSHWADRDTNLDKLVAYEQNAISTNTYCACKICYPFWKGDLR